MRIILLKVRSPTDIHPCYVLILTGRDPIEDEVVVVGIGLCIVWRRRSKRLNRLHPSRCTRGTETRLVAVDVHILQAHHVESRNRISIGVCILRRTAGRIPSWPPDVAPREYPVGEVVYGARDILISRLWWLRHFKNAYRMGHDYPIEDQHRITEVHDDEFCLVEEEIRVVEVSD